MWNNIIGQDRVKSILKNIYQSGKISHAYIFYGNEGTGKDAIAIEFAKLLNCDNSAGSFEACDTCKSCTEINNFKSQIVKFIIALPSGKNETDDEFNPVEKLEKEDFNNYLSEMELKSLDKYHKISIPKANDIRISSIRQIKNQIYLTGKTGKRKIFIISKCDMMNPNSSNALLKILEEPPKDSVIILTTSRINSLLPTIIGRCQKIKSDDISSSLIFEYINSKEPGISEPEAKFFAELSEGSITKCNEILEENLIELREKVMDILTSVVTGQNIKLGKEIDFITGKKDKERIKKFLVLLIIWFRDLTSYSNNNEKLLINTDKIDRISRFAKNFSSDNYRIINKIEEAIRDLDSNIFPELIMYNLFLFLKSSVKKKSNTL